VTCHPPGQPWDQPITLGRSAVAGPAVIAVPGILVAIGQEQCLGLFLSSAGSTLFLVAVS